MESASLWSVIPARDEETTISQVIEECLLAGSEKVLVVVNGSSDRTAKCAKGFPSERVLVYEVEEPLGLDVPRALGGYIAYLYGASYILFCDGDLSGRIASHLASLFGSMTWGYDLSLSNCYPRGIPGGGMAGRVIAARLELNRKIGREDLGAAVMSHGPSCISRRFLDVIPCHVLGIPPLAQALAVKMGLTVKVGAALHHNLLGSKERHGSHPDKIADLIIGDCLLATSVFQGGLPVRCRQGTAYIGFDNERRWDLLELHLKKVRSANLFPTLILG